jgi:hypothetical protein
MSMYGATGAARVDRDGVGLGGTEPDADAEGPTRHVKEGPTMRSPLRLALVVVAATATAGLWSYRPYSPTRSQRLAPPSPSTRRCARWYPATIGASISAVRAGGSNHARP